MGCYENIVSHFFCNKNKGYNGKLLLIFRKRGKYNDNSRNYYWIDN